MLHGWGMDKTEMAQFFPLFSEKKDCLLVALQAPYWRENVQGYSWFSMKARVRDAFRGEHADDIRRNQLIPAIEAEFDKLFEVIEYFCKKYNIQDYHLLGYSQGAMMALHAGICSPLKPMSIISISGYGVFEMLDKADATKSKISLITGAKDKIVQPQYQQQLYDYFKQRKADISLTMIENIGHIPLSEQLMQSAYRQVLY